MKVYIIIISILAVVLIAVAVYFFAINQNISIAYKCPDTEWLNCMPGPDDTDRKYCPWVEENCPDQKIAY